MLYSNPVTYEGWTSPTGCSLIHWALEKTASSASGICPSLRSSNFTAYVWMKCRAYVDRDWYSPPSLSKAGFSNSYKHNKKIIIKISWQHHHCYTYKIHWQIIVSGQHFIMPVKHLSVAIVITGIRPAITGIRPAKLSDWKHSSPGDWGLFVRILSLTLVKTIFLVDQNITEPETT